jgi:tetratricopeptide (TPR) repeat protein
LAAFAVAALSCPAQDDPSGPQLVRLGRLDDALRVYLRDVEAAPKSVAANNGAGVVLDLMGRSPQARTYFGAAIRSSHSPGEKAQAQRAMAISYGFAGDCRGVQKYDGEAFDFYLGASAFSDAGETPNELARLCLDLGEINKASDWYQRGHETALQQENLGRARVDLWDFRWAHSRARIAARRGNLREAARFVSAAKAILAKGTNPDQEIYFPYLQGYVAFYTGDYAGALKALQDAQQTDPFIRLLMARSHEKLGDSANAALHYRAAAASTAHSVPAALARPAAIRKLAGEAARR